VQGGLLTIVVPGGLNAVVDYLYLVPEAYETMLASVLLLVISKTVGTPFSLRQH
jgi:hypothetical protein